MTPAVDYLIIGQGLAGSIIAWQALLTDKSVCVIDPCPAFNASKVAAGIIDPIAGRRYSQAWNAHIVLPYLATFYPKIEAITGQTYYYKKPSLRFFTSLEDRLLWEKKHTYPRLIRYFNTPPQASFHPDITPPYYGVEATESAYLDTKKFLQDTQTLLRSKKMFIQDHFDRSKLQLTDTGCHYNHITAKFIIFCEGYEVSNNPLFNWLPWNHSKGNILTATCSLPETHILHYGKWILPTHTHEFRIGATYATDFTHTDPDPEAKTILLETLSTWIKTPLTIIDHQAAVRPISIDNRPIIGPHPQHPRLVIFNAMGSRASSLGPYYSEQLLSHLEKNAPLDQDVDITRFTHPINR